MLTLQEIKAEVDRLAAKIGASGYDLPTYGHSEDGARPHIEVNALGYHYVVVERGSEESRLTTLNLDELLEKIFKSVTFNLACKYELAHRVEFQDSRRILFPRQIGLLNALSANWAERAAQHHQERLRQHPLDDFASARATLCGNYRAQGETDDDAWLMACEKYPLPADKSTTSKIPLKTTPARTPPPI
jgi:hypothetical protein